MKENNLKIKLILLIVTVVLLICGLTLTSFALVDSIVRVQNNSFSMSMGVVMKVNNDWPININDIIFEPGETRTCEFPISNLGTFDIWYRVYFTEVSGDLQDDITVTIREKNGQVLGKATMGKLTSDNVTTSFISSVDGINEKIICIDFYFSPDVEKQGGDDVTFNIKVDATQKPNNPYMDFGD